MENNEDRVKNTYKKICLYDKIMDLPWWAKLAGNVVWGFHTIGFIEKLLSDIPDDFDGELLDIPAGSSNFTLEKYKKLKNCTISSVDYSSEMLEISKRKFEKENLMQIKFYEESVYALPFYSFEEVRMFLEDKFSEVSIENQKSIVYFSCKK